MGIQVIGRAKECQLLKDCEESSQSEFVAVVGRRRIGKTFLINQYFKDSICFYSTGIQNQPIEAQLQAFTNELSIRQKKHIPLPKDWQEAFLLLQQYLKSLKTKKKKVIFLDELPWMDTAKSGFLSMFGYFWNSWAAWEGNIILIIAGSSTSWIVNKIFNNTGGLHNRVTKRIYLLPFTLKESNDFLKSKNINITEYEIVLIYMAMGGVPFYLDQIKRGESAAQCIQRLFFSENGMLKTEFENLFRAIFFKADAHIRVVKVLAKHRYGLNRTDLLKKAKITNSGGGSKILEELLQTDYIEYIVPFGKKSSNGKFVLNDFYSLFYLNFVNGVKNGNWQSLTETPKYKTWCGLSFERVCFMHTEQIYKSLGIHGIYNETSYLNLKDEKNKVTAQIDMLIERGDNFFNLCEIKFWNKEYSMTEKEYENIRNKKAELRKKIKQRQGIFGTMITTFGCERNMHYLSCIESEVTLHDLFAD